MSSADDRTVITPDYISEFLSGYYEEIPNDILEGTVSYSVGAAENVKLSKDKLALVATQFQSVDIIGDKSFSPIKLSNVRIGDSEGRGKGIFAKREIKTNEVITLYPVDVCEVYDDNSKYLYYSEFFMKFSHENADNGHEEFKRSIAEYNLNFKDGRNILAFPSNNSSEAFLGHIANDGATDFSSRRSYLATSIAARNAVIRPIPEKNPFIYALVATKDIPEGSEIFLSYSMDFWFKNKDVEYLEFFDEKSDPVIDQIRKLHDIEDLCKFRHFSKSKVLTIYRRGNDIICFALLINKKGNKNMKYKYSSNNYHRDVEGYNYQMLFMNKSPQIPDQLFSDFLLTIAKRHSCIIFSNEEIKLFSDSGFQLLEG